MNSTHKDFKMTQIIVVQRGFKDWRILMVDFLEELKLSPLYVAYLNKKKEFKKMKILIIQW